MTHLCTEKRSDNGCFGTTPGVFSLVDMTVLTKGLYFHTHQICFYKTVAFIGLVFLIMCLIFRFRPESNVGMVLDIVIGLWFHLGSIRPENFAS